jgi:hypothetical protein
MRAALTALSVLLLAMAGCNRITGSPLDWGENSFRKVPTGATRGLTGDRLDFAAQVDAQGRLKEAAFKEYPVEIRGMPESAVVGLHALDGFNAAIWFRGFDASKLAVSAADVSLVDNRGNRFTVLAVKPGYDCAAEFRVEPTENAIYMEFNNRDYYLTLNISFTYDGKAMTASWPKVYCVFDNPLRR